ncbi:hypothetical protein [Microvirga lenta]|uniref:hypothetical protein n=1 Tax=Microvirga lenta TaxID=2881337 RepID=UPI001CFF7259|nr:hypothetical protein [Microvirga lenta]MCB5176428.1 hypothetical protein [Microvirga lenta]
MTILRAIKNLIPLSARRSLKERLPTQLVGLIATAPARGASSAQTKASKSKPIAEKPQCPICGTPFPPPDEQTTTCAGCGSAPHHRRLALAAYACEPLPNRRVLALGSDPLLKTIFDGMDGIHFAEDLSEVPPELHGRVDLCVHSGFLRNDDPRPEKALKSIDALLSPGGRQVFALGAVAGSWRKLKWRQDEEALVQWLRRKGWLEPLPFEPMSFYGANAAATFGYESPDHNTSEAVVILLKTSTKVG